MSEVTHADPVFTVDELRERWEDLRGWDFVPVHYSRDPEFVRRDDGSLALAVNADGDERKELLVTQEFWNAVSADLSAGKGFMEKTPPSHVLPLLNWWYGSEDAKKPEISILTKGDVATEILKQGSNPVNPDGLLEAIAGVMPGGQSPQYLYDWRRGLRTVTIGVIHPEYNFEVQGRQTGDVLQGGALVSFSPIGASPLTVHSFVNRLICTNGMTSSDLFDEWSAPGGEGAQTGLEWLPTAIENSLANVEAQFRACQRMAEQELDESRLGVVIDDVFNHYRVPTALRGPIIEQLAETNLETMWDLVNVITYVGTHSQSRAFTENPARRVRALALGGDVAMHADRCEACSHLLTE